MNKNQNNQHKLIIGRFGKTYGLKGWLHVHSFTEPTNNILQYSPWYVKKRKEWQVLEVEESKSQGNKVIVKPKDSSTPETGKTYTNLEIATDKNQLPKLQKDEYYWHQLERLEVINKSGKHLGVISHLLATGANDIIVVKQDKQELLIPYLDDVILEIDLANNKMTIDWE